MFSKNEQLRKTIIDAHEFREIVDNEAALQRQSEELLDIRHIHYLRIPDAVFRYIFGLGSSVSARIKQLISKYLAGQPDLIVFRKLNNKYCLACRIELKTKRGKLSQGQKNRSKELPLIIVRSFEQLQREISEFENFPRQA